jgi:predicted Rossmann-fold nucleotide-binding protein
MLGPKAPSGYAPAGRSPQQAAALAFRRGSTANVFATTIAKYFSNALREDTLIHRCGGGVVYLPGLAGTVQEIFQAVTENFYAADASLVTPLILMGREYWTEVYPAWPLLQRLGAGRPMGKLIFCVDDVKEAFDLLTAEA